MSAKKHRAPKQGVKEIRTGKSRVKISVLFAVLITFAALCLVTDTAFAVFAGISIASAEHGTVIPAAFTPFAFSVIGINAALALFAALYPILRLR